MVLFFSFFNDLFDLGKINGKTEGGKGSDDTASHPSFENAGSEESKDTKKFDEKYSIENSYREYENDIYNKFIPPHTEITSL